MSESEYSSCRQEKDLLNQAQSYLRVFLFFLSHESLLGDLKIYGTGTNPKKTHPAYFGILHSLCQYCLDPFYRTGVRFHLAGDSFQLSFLFPFLAGYLTAIQIIPNNASHDRTSAEIDKVFDAGRSFSSLSLMGAIAD